MCLRLLWYIKRNRLNSIVAYSESPIASNLKLIQGAIVCFYIMYIYFAIPLLSRGLCAMSVCSLHLVLAGNHQQVPSKAARLYYAEKQAGPRLPCVRRERNDDTQSRSSALSAAAVVQKDSAVLLYSYFQSSINQRRRRA